MSFTSKADCKQVGAILASRSAHLPASAANMLVAGLPKLVRSEGELHPYQEELIAHVTRQLASEQQRVAGAQEALESRSAAAAETSTELCNASNRVIEEQQAAMRELDDRTKVLDEATQYESTEEAEHKAVIEKDGVVKSNVADIRKRKQEVRDIMDDSLRTSVAGAWSAPGQKKARKEEDVYEVELWIQDNCDDPVLVVATGAALKVEAENRTDFDRAVVDGVAEVFEQKDQRLEEGLVKATRNEVLVGQEAMGAWAVWDVARERRAEAAAAHAEASASKDAVDAECKSINEKMSAQDRLVEDLASERTLLASQQTNVVEAFAAMGRLTAAGSYAGAGEEEACSPQSKGSPQQAKPEVETSTPPTKKEAEEEKPAAVATVMLGA